MVSSRPPVARTTGTGFKFSDYTGDTLLATIRQALTAFKDQTGWQALMRNGMGKDFSWTNSAREYVRIYEKSRQLRTVHGVEVVTV